MDATRAIRETVAAETLPLDAAGDALTCGHKAAALAALRRAGFPVPDGFVVPVHASISVRSLAGALERLGPGPWAVRSSGIAEDLDDASFAGQYESVLGVTTVEDVVAAGPTSPPPQNPTAAMRQAGAPFFSWPRIAPAG